MTAKIGIFRCGLFAEPPPHLADNNLGSPSGSRIAFCCPFWWRQRPNLYSRDCFGDQSARAADSWVTLVQIKEETDADAIVELAAPLGLAMGDELAAILVNEIVAFYFASGEHAPSADVRGADRCFLRRTWHPELNAITFVSRRWIATFLQFM